MLPAKGPSFHVRPRSYSLAHEHGHTCTMDEGSVVAARTPSTPLHHSLIALERDACQLVQCGVACVQGRALRDAHGYPWQRNVGSKSTHIFEYSKVVRHILSVTNEPLPGTGCCEIRLSWLSDDSLVACIFFSACQARSAIRISLGPPVLFLLEGESCADFWELTTSWGRAPTFALFSRLLFERACSMRDSWIDSTSLPRVFFVSSVNVTGTSASESAKRSTRYSKASCSVSCVAPTCPQQSHNHMAITWQSRGKLLCRLRRADLCHGG